MNHIEARANYPQMTSLFSVKDFKWIFEMDPDIIATGEVRLTEKINKLKQEKDSVERKLNEIQNKYRSSSDIEADQILKLSKKQ